MNEKRIKQAENNFKRYFSEGKIRKENFNPIIYNTYLKNSFESLSCANALFHQKISPLWVVVSSYYAMFYVSCGYLYSLGYKINHEISHQVVNESLIVQARHKIKNHLLENYSEEKEKALAISDNYLDNYEREKTKRANFQYETTDEIKWSRAKTSLQRAKEFVELLREILNE